MSQDRPTSILTKNQREYLRGDREPTQERTMKTRIRERVRTGLLDFELLADPDCFGDNDLQLIRELQDESGEPVTEDLLRAGGEVTEEPVLDPEIGDALVNMIAFAFRVRPGQSYFESVVRTGVEQALDRHPSDAEVGEVSVPIEVPNKIRQRVERYLKEDLPLTDAEIRIALEHEMIPPEEIAEHVQEHGTRREGVSREALQNLHEDLEKWGSSFVAGQDDLPGQDEENRGEDE